MGRFSCLFIIAVVAYVAFADTSVTLKFASDENLTDASSRFQFRFQSTDVYKTDLLAKVISNIPKKVLTWRSSSVNFNKDISSKAEGDTLIGLAFPPSEYSFPFAVVAYGTGKTAIKMDASEFIAAVATNSSLKEFEGGLVAMAALSLEEYTPKGKYVDNSLVPLIGVCDPEEIQEKKKNAFGMTCEMKGLVKNNPVKVTITYVTSKKAGILKYGWTPVSPRSLEMIVEVENYELTSKKNHARLNVGFLSVSGAGKIVGKSKVIKKGKEEVYAAASTYVMVDKDRKEVEVDISKLKEHPTCEAFEKVMSLVLGIDYDIHLAAVDFPAGEQSFVYDPAAGSGSNVYESVASATILSLFVALVCALLFLF